MLKGIVGLCMVLISINTHSGCEQVESLKRSSGVHMDGTTLVVPSKTKINDAHLEQVVLTVSSEQGLEEQYPYYYYPETNFNAENKLEFSVLEGHYYTALYFTIVYRGERYCANYNDDFSGFQAKGLKIIQVVFDVDI